MIPNNSGDVRDFTGDFIIPAGNGLPDLHVTALEPLMHLQDQFVARSGDVQEASTTDTGGSSIASHLGFPSVDEIKAGFKGFVKTTAVVVIGILLIILGAYQITKE